MLRGSVAVKALAAQVCAVLLTLVSAKLLSGTLAFWSLLVLQSLFAVSFSLVLKLPRWWLPIQALFVPALAAALSLKIHPGFYLLVFLLLWLFFRSNTEERVPLYLTNSATYHAVLELLPAQPNLKFIDLGSGFAGLLVFLAKHRPNQHFTGVESAPAPFFISRLKSWALPNLTIHFGSLWQRELAAYDVVYAFLSPEPMPALWQKIQTEMRPGSLLISNSFQIPDVSPSKMVAVDDRRQTRLWVWEVRS